MRLETFRGSSWSNVFSAARKAIGDDVMIVRTETLRGSDGASFVEVVAASARELDKFRRRLEPRPVRESLTRRGRPYVVALIGPTGAGKTTTLAKLAVHPDYFGGRRVGMITLDTYRAGALEQLQAYADVAGIPMEVVYDARDVDAARRRLSECEVILVDTPGRSPRAQHLDLAWRKLLDRLQPDEVHLVVPATLRQDLARGVRESFLAAEPTHLILSKCDEVPSDSGLAELAVALELPVRWITDGQDVPTDLHDGGTRILASLGRLTASGSSSTHAAVASVA
jgi:flagellar biosynthesis protein FlhF